jgi:hypothetical protein
VGTSLDTNNVEAQPLLLDGARATSNRVYDTLRAANRSAVHYKTELNCNQRPSKPVSDGSTEMSTP